MLHFIEVYLSSYLHVCQRFGGRIDIPRPFATSQPCPRTCVLVHHPQVTSVERDQCTDPARLLQSIMRAMSGPVLTGLLLLTDLGIGAEGTSIGFLIHNQYGSNVHISGDWAAKDLQQYGEINMPDQSYILENDTTVFLEAFRDTSPKYYIGLTPNTRDIGAKRDHDTVIEATFYNQDGDTYYDVDVEKGISVPIWCHAQTERWDAGRGCQGDVMSDCSEHLQHYDEETGMMDQCIGEASLTDIKRRRRNCRQAYVMSDDDARGINKVHNTSGTDSRSHDAWWAFDLD